MRWGWLVCHLGPCWLGECHLLPLLLPCCLAVITLPESPPLLPLPLCLLQSILSFSSSLTPTPPLPLNTQVYQSKSAEFREAIASLLGLKLAFYPNGQVRFTSLFDLNAVFVFQPAGAGSEDMKMQLIAKGDGGPEELPQLVRYWVQEEQSIPCFMASVTLQCYEKNKLESQGDVGH